MLIKVGSVDYNRLIINYENFLESGRSSPIKYIIDVTMAWKDGITPLIGDMFGSYRSPQKTHLLYRIYNISEVCTHTF